MFVTTKRNLEIYNVRFCILQVPYAVWLPRDKTYLKMQSIWSTKARRWTKRAAWASSGSARKPFWKSRYSTSLIYINYTINSALIMLLTPCNRTFCSPDIRHWSPCSSRSLCRSSRWRDWRWTLNAQKTTQSSLKWTTFRTSASSRPSYKTEPTFHLYNRYSR